MLLPNIIHKLTTLEAETEDPVQFWLESHRFLSPTLCTPTDVLHWLHHRDRVGPAQYYAQNECEECLEQMVAMDHKNDDQVCLSCGFIQQQYRDPFRIVVPASSVYKHDVHLHQILHEMQCLRHRIPDQIVSDLKDHLGADVSYERIQKSLRSLGYKQHYQMIPTLQLMLDPSFEPLILTREEEEAIMARFHQYIVYYRQPPLPGATRKNKLNYHYVLYKISQLCGFDWVMPYCHFPRGKKSIKKNEQEWEQICKGLHWPFLPLI